MKNATSANLREHKVKMCGKEADYKQQKLQRWKTFFIKWAKNEDLLKTKIEVGQMDVLKSIPAFRS